MLEIHNLDATINNKAVLKNISLSVDYGEISVLLGSSGVGKSTLLRVLNNLQPFESGTIRLDGKPVDLHQVNRNHTIGMLSQHFDLFKHLTAKENITLVLEKVAGLSKKAASERADNLLKQYSIESLADSYPGQLSGGQKQRLAIARMISLRPKIVCFDEPTSALDPALTRFVASNIQELARKGYIVLVATHDTLLLEHLSCTIHLMHGGKIVQSAQAHDFWNNRTKYPAINDFISGAASV